MRAGGQDHASQKQHPARGEAAPPGPAWGLRGPPAPTCVPWGSAEVDVGPSRLPAPQQWAAFPAIRGENCVSHGREAFAKKQHGRDVVSCNASLQCVAETKWTEKQVSGLFCFTVNGQFIYLTKCAAKHVLQQSCLGPRVSSARRCSADIFSICLAGASQHCLSHVAELGQALAAFNTLRIWAQNHQ